MQFDFPDQAESLDAIVAAHSGMVIAIPRASGAVEMLTQNESWLVHVDGSATVDGRVTLTRTEVQTYA